MNEPQNIHLNNMNPRMDESRGRAARRTYYPNADNSAMMSNDNRQTEVSAGLTDQEREAFFGNCVPPRRSTVQQQQPQPRRQRLPYDLSSMEEEAVRGALALRSSAPAAAAAALTEARSISSIAQTSSAPSSSSRPQANPHPGAHLAGGPNPPSPSASLSGAAGASAVPPPPSEPPSHRSTDESRTALLTAMGYPDLPTVADQRMVLKAEFGKRLEAAKIRKRAEDLAAAAAERAAAAAAAAQQQQQQQQQASVQIEEGTKHRRRLQRLLANQRTQEETERRRGRLAARQIEEERRRLREAERLAAATLKAEARARERDERRRSILAAETRALREERDAIAARLRLQIEEVELRKVRVALQRGQRMQRARVVDAALAAQAQAQGGGSIGGVGMQAVPGRNMAAPDRRILSLEARRLPRELEEVRAAFLSQAAATQQQQVARAMTLGSGDGNSAPPKKRSMIASTMTAEEASAKFKRARHDALLPTVPTTTTTTTTTTTAAGTGRAYAPIAPSPYPPQQQHAQAAQAPPSAGVRRKPGRPIGTNRASQHGRRNNDNSIRRMSRSDDRILPLPKSSLPRNDDGAAAAAAGAAAGKKDLPSSSSSSAPVVRPVAPADCWVRPKRSASKSKKASASSSSSSSFPLPKLWKALDTIKEEEEEEEEAKDGAQVETTAGGRRNQQAVVTPPPPAYTPPAIKSELKSYRNSWDGIEATLLNHHNPSPSSSQQQQQQQQQQHRLIDPLQELSPNEVRTELLDRFLHAVETNRIRIVKDESITGVYGVNSEGEVRKRIDAATAAAAAQAATSVAAPKKQGMLVDDYERDEGAHFGAHRPTTATTTTGRSSKSYGTSTAPSLRQQRRSESKDAGAGGGSQIPLMMPLERNSSCPMSA